LSNARDRFAVFIAEQLEKQDDVGKSDLAEGFIDREPAIAKKLSAYAIRVMLKRWAEEILKEAGDHTADQRPQLVLPFSMKGLAVHRAYSFHIPRKLVDEHGVESIIIETRHVASYKAEGWHIKSHIQIQIENEAAIARSRLNDENLYASCAEFFEADPHFKLIDALRILREREQNAA
jgi:hypothetical protein